MDKPTKVQITVAFDEIPQKALSLLREKVLREVGFVANVLQQVVGRTDALPVEDLSFGVEQARRCLFNADLYLQDAQDMLNGYSAHKAQADLTALQSQQNQIETDHTTLVKGPVVEKSDDKENEINQEPSKPKK